MYLEELSALPDALPSLRDAGFYVGGFDPFTDNVVTPVVLIGMKLAPRLLERALARLFLWSLRAFAGPPYGTVLQLDMHGETNLRLRLSHPDAYDLTAIPVAAALLQWMDGTSRRPGLHTMANLVDPVRLLADIGRMGVRIEELVTPAPVPVAESDVTSRRRAPHTPRTPCTRRCR